MHGESVHNMVVKPGINHIDAGDLEAGMYIVSYHWVDRMQSKRILLVR